jgi:hypothetical protein
MRTILVVTLAVALAALGLALATPNAEAGGVCIDGKCVNACLTYWYCLGDPCDPSTQCCGPECAPP